MAAGINFRRKNDPKSRAGLLHIERESITALERARDAVALGKANAKNWVASHDTVRTVRAALAIDDDPALADESRMPVTRTDPTLENHCEQAR